VVPLRGTALIAVRATKEPASKDAGVSGAGAWKSNAREETRRFDGSARSLSDPPRITRGGFIRATRGN